MIEYFALDLGDRHAGLIRHNVDDEAQTETIEGVIGGEWVDDPSLLRYFAGYGGDQLDLVPLTEDEARARAAELGVAL
jgi:hypothetical protein